MMSGPEISADAPATWAVGLFGPLDDRCFRKRVCV